MNTITDDDIIKLAESHANFFTVVNDKEKWKALKNAYMQGMYRAIELQNPKAGSAKQNI